MSETKRGVIKRLCAVLLMLCLMPSFAIMVSAEEDGAIYNQDEIAAWQDFMTLYTALTRNEDPFSDTYFDQTEWTVKPIAPGEWAGVMWVEKDETTYIQSIILREFIYYDEDGHATVTADGQIMEYFREALGSYDRTGDAAVWQPNTLSELEVLDLSGSGLEYSVFPSHPDTWEFDFAALKETFPKMRKLNMSNNHLWFSELPLPAELAAEFPGITYAYGGQTRLHYMQPEPAADGGIYAVDYEVHYSRSEEITGTVTGVSEGAYQRIEDEYGGEGFRFLSAASGQTARMTFTHSSFPDLVLDYTYTVPNLYTYLYHYIGIVSYDENGEYISTEDGYYVSAYGTEENGTHWMQISEGYGSHADKSYSGIYYNLTTHPDAAVSIPTSGTLDISSQNVAFTISHEGATESYVIYRAGRADRKDFATYSLSGYAGTIDEASGSVDVTVPAGTNLTALEDSFTVQEGIIVSAPSGTDFNVPVTYTLTASNGTTKEYTVYVSVEGSDCSCAIGAVTFDPVSYALPIIETGQKTTTVSHGTAREIKIHYQKEIAMMNNISVNDVLSHLHYTDGGACKVPGHRTNGYTASLSVSGEHSNTAGASVLHGEVYNTSNRENIWYSGYVKERVIQYNQPGVFTAMVTVTRNSAAETVPVPVTITDMDDFRFTGEDAADGVLSAEYVGSSVRVEWSDAHASDSGVFYKAFLRSYKDGLGEGYGIVGNVKMPKSWFFRLQNTETVYLEEIDVPHGQTYVDIPINSRTPLYVTIQRFTAPYVGTFEAAGTDFTKHINIPVVVEKDAPDFGITLDSPNYYTRKRGDTSLGFSVTQVEGLENYDMYAKFGDGNNIARIEGTDIPLGDTGDDIVLTFDYETFRGTITLGQTLLDKLNLGTDGKSAQSLLNIGLKSKANGATIVGAHDWLTVHGMSAAAQLADIVDAKDNLLGTYTDANDEVIKTGGTLEIGPGFLSDAELAALTPADLENPETNPYTYVKSIHEKKDASKDAEMLIGHIRYNYDITIADPTVCELLIAEYPRGVYVRALRTGDTTITFDGINGDTFVLDVSCKLNEGTAALFYLTEQTGAQDNIQYRFGASAASMKKYVSSLKAAFGQSNPFAGKPVRFRDKGGEEKTATISADGALYLYDKDGLDTEYLDGSFVSGETHYHLSFDNYYTGEHNAYMATDPLIHTQNSQKSESDYNTRFRAEDDTSYYIVADGEIINFAVIPYFCVDWSEKAASSSLDNSFVYAVPLEKTMETLDSNGNIMTDFFEGEFAALSMSMTLISPEKASVPLSASLYHAGADDGVSTKKTLYRGYNQGTDIFVGSGASTIQRHTYIPALQGWGFVTALNVEVLKEFYEGDYQSKVDKNKFPFTDYFPWPANALSQGAFDVGKVDEKAEGGTEELSKHYRRLSYPYGITDYTDRVMLEPNGMLAWFIKTGRVNVAETVKNYKKKPMGIDLSEWIKTHGRDYAGREYFQYHYNEELQRDILQKYAETLSNTAEQLATRYAIPKDLYKQSNQGYILDEWLSKGAIRPIDYLDGDVVVEISDQRKEGTEGWYAPSSAIFPLRDYFWQRHLNSYVVSAETVKATPSNGTGNVVRGVVKDQNDTVMDISLDRWGIELSQGHDKKLMLYLNSTRQENITGAVAYINNKEITGATVVKDVTEEQMKSKWYLATTALTDDLVEQGETFTVDYVIFFEDGKTSTYSSNIQFRSFQNITQESVEAQLTPDSLPFTGTVSSGAFDTQTAQKVDGFDFPLPADFSVRVEYDFSQGYNRGTFKMLVGREQDLAAGDDSGDTMSDRIAAVGAQMHNLQGNRSAYGSVTSGFSAGFTACGYVEGIVRFTGKEFSLIATGGGIMVAADMGYAYNVNTVIGFIPVYYGIEVGGGLSANVSFLRTDLENDEDFGLAYRTIVSAYGSVKVSGGIGFDFGLFAAKFGPYGLLETTYSIGFLHNKSNNYFGQQVTVHGEVGIEAVLKFLFFSERYVLCDAGFTWTTGSGDTWIFDGDLEPPQSGRMMGGMRVASLEDYNPDGEPIGEYVWLDLGTEIESRDYLKNVRTWASPASKINLMRAVDVSDGSPAEMVSNAYPYAYPYISGDGEMIVMMDDGASADLNNTTPIYVLNNTPDKIDPTETTPSSNVAFDGDDSFGVAAWENLPILFDGDNKADPYDYVNKSEIKAAVFNGSEWTTTRLTDNGVPDMGPKVAVNGARAAVVWANVDKREVGGNVGAENKTLLMSRYADNAWGADVIDLGIPAATNVQNYDVALASDGSALVIYTYQTKNGISEIAAIHVSQSGAVSIPISLSGGDAVNSGVKASTARIGDEEYFVTAWYRRALEDGASDIRLQAFDLTGVKKDVLATGLADNRQSDDPDFSENFEFVKGTNGAIAWANPYARDLAEVGEYGIFAKYLLKPDGTAGLSAAYKIAKGTQDNIIDAFTVTKKEDGTLYTVFAATQYDTSDVKDAPPSELNSLAVQSNLFTATASIVNKAEITGLHYLAKAAVGTDSAIKVSLRNTGTVDVSSVEIFVNNISQGEILTAIVPNEAVELSVAHAQNGALTDADIYARVTFADDTSFTTNTETAVFVLPDIAIDSVAVFDENAIGTGRVTVTLSDRGFADLSGKTVSLGVYEDIERTVPAAVTGTLSNLVLTDDATGVRRTQVTFSCDLDDYDNTGHKVLYIKASITDGENALDELDYTNNEGVAVFNDPAPLIARQFAVEISDVSKTVTASAKNGLNQGVLARLLIQAYDSNAAVVESHYTNALYVDMNGLAVFKPVTFTSEYARLVATVDVSDDIPVAMITEDLPATANLGETLSITSTASQNAALSYQWFYGYSPIAGLIGGNAMTAIDGATNASYTLPDTLSDEEAESLYYFCIASAEAGTDVLSATVLVEAAAGGKYEITDIAVSGSDITQKTAVVSIDVPQALITPAPKLIIAAYKDKELTALQIKDVSADTIEEGAVSFVIDLTGATKIRAVLWGSFGGIIPLCVYPEEPLT